MNKFDTLYEEVMKQYENTAIIDEDLKSIINWLKLSPKRKIILFDFLEYVGSVTDNDEQKLNKLKEVILYLKTYPEKQQKIIDYYKTHEKINITSPTLMEILNIFKDNRRLQYKIHQGVRDDKAGNQAQQMLNQVFA